MSWVNKYSIHFVMGSLNQFRSKNVLNKIFEWLPHLCSPHKCPSVNFKHRFRHKTSLVFPMPHKEWHLLEEADTEYPFWAWWINTVITLHGVSIHPVTTKLRAYFKSQLPERKETAQGFHHEANGDFKTVTPFNGCDRRKLRMNQQHCSFSTILTWMTVKKRKPVQNKNTQTCILFSIKH